MCLCRLVICYLTVNTINYTSQRNRNKTQFETKHRVCFFVCLGFVLDLLERTLSEHKVIPKGCELWSSLANRLVNQDYQKKKYWNFNSSRSTYKILMFVILSSIQVTLIIHSFTELRKGFKRYQIYMSIIWVGLFTFFKTAKWFIKKSVNCSITVYISYSL